MKATKEWGAAIITVFVAAAVLTLSGCSGSGSTSSSASIATTGGSGTGDAITKSDFDDINVALASVGFRLNSVEAPYGTNDEGDVEFTTSFYCGGGGDKLIIGGGAIKHAVSICVSDGNMGFADDSNSKVLAQAIAKVIGFDEDDPKYNDKVTMAEESMSVKNVIAVLHDIKLSESGLVLR